MEADPSPEGEVPAQPRRSWLPANALRVMSINVVFGLLIGCGLYATTERAALLHLMGFSGAGGISGAGEPREVKGSAITRAVPLTGAASLTPDDPVLRFAESRIGHMLFSSMQSDNCQRVLFNNNTGVSFEAPGVFCGQKANKVAEADSPKRLNAVRSSFQR